MRHLKWKWCALSMCTTLGLLWLVQGTPGNAVSPPAQAPAENPTPTLIVNDVMVQFTQVSEKLAAGATPTATLTITNPTDQPVNLQLPVMVNGRDWTPPMSRMMPMPRTMWSDTLQLKLQPNQTVTHTLEPLLKANAGATLTFYAMKEMPDDTKKNPFFFNTMQKDSIIASKAIPVELSDQQKKGFGGLQARGQVQQVRNDTAPAAIQATNNVQAARQVVNAARQVR